MSLSSNCKDDKDEVIDNSRATSDEEPHWKIVGSRRGSVVQSQQQPQQPFEHSRQETISSEKQWGSFGGFQWEGPSIFDEETAANTSKAPRPEPYFDPTFMLPAEPLFRHQRSFSFSMGQDPTFFGYDDYSTRNNSLLAPTLEEDENEQIQDMNIMAGNRLHHSMDDAYFRSRSQSINSAFGLYSPSNSTNSSSSSYWVNPTRRSSLGFVHPTSPTSTLPPHVEKAGHFTDYSFPEIIPNGPNNNNNNYTTIQQLSDMVEKNNLHTTPVDSLSTESASAGKGISLLKLPPHILLYMVEFKSGRTDFYYASDALMQLHIGDLVIVEADRGKDLGKIATDTLTINQVALLKQQQQTSNSNRLILDEEYNDKKSDTFVKKIYRKALQDEISLLPIKEQDEQKALTICLQKIKNRKLQMEVVDAEFQWDRRKLTFYFIAEKRIDFRELVRELFKIYKTRIWMCAVNPTIPIKSVTSSS